MFEHGAVSRTSPEAIILLASLDEACVDTEQGLKEWELLGDMLGLDSEEKTRGRGVSFSFKSLSGRPDLQERCVCAILLYINAHEQACSEVQKWFGADMTADSPEEIVPWKSQWNPVCSGGQGDPVRVSPRACDHGSIQDVGSEALALAAGRG